MTQSTHAFVMLYKQFIFHIHFLARISRLAWPTKTTASYIKVSTGLFAFLGKIASNALLKIVKHREGFFFADVKKTLEYKMWMSWYFSVMSCSKLWHTSSFILGRFQERYCLQNVNIFLLFYIALFKLWNTRQFYFRQSCVQNVMSWCFSCSKLWHGKQFSRKVLCT